MTIIQSITELLSLNKSVAIPRLGTLTTNDIPAKINLVTNHFSPPSSRIDFVLDRTLQDETLEQHLAKSNNTSPDEARQQIIDFANNCNTELQDNGRTMFEGLGTLSHKYDGSYEFELNESVNFNKDAFGLPDFHQNPILRNECPSETKPQETQAEIAPEVTESPKTKQTEEEKTDNTYNSNETETTKKKRRIWPWLLLLLIAISAFILLTYLRLIPNYIPQIIKTEEPINIVTGGEPRPNYHYEYEEPADTTTYPLPYPEAQAKFNDSIQHVVDSMAMETAKIAIDTTLQAEVATTTPDTTKADSNAIDEQKEAKAITEPIVEPQKAGTKHHIVCGCFSVEENAQKKVNMLHENGFTNAFYKKHGTMWNVYYDSYDDKQEAKQALDEIRATVNPKAWLLTRK